MLQPVLKSRGQHYIKDELSTDNRAEHDMTYDGDWAANVPQISVLEATKKNRQKTYQMKTSCVEQVAVKSVVREATINRGGVRRRYVSV